MGKIEKGRLLYHLTKLDNLDTIVQYGLLSREDMKKAGLEFENVADLDIIKFRQEHDLEKYIPFHFFGNTPFDGDVRKKYVEDDFIYLCIHRDDAEYNNFKIIPKHPLSMKPFMMYSYKEGLDIIDWDTMEQRDYHDKECKQICMAECLCDKHIPINALHCIEVKDDRVYKIVKEKLKGNTSVHIDVAPWLFK